MLHQDLDKERWFKLSLIEQLANIGCDVERTIRWRNRGALESSTQAFWRVLELMDLTIADPKNHRRLREIVRTRYILVDHFVYDNVHQTTDKIWQNYFLWFNYAAAAQSGK
jgi:hypothetical protein